MDWKNISDKDLKDFIITQVAGCDYDEKLKILERISMAVKSVQDDIFENIEYCDCCKKRFNKTECETCMETRTEVEKTYSDAGYGDDDLFGDVTADYYYYICPHCHGRVYKDRHIRYIKNERRRGE